MEMTTMTMSPGSQFAGASLAERHTGSRPVTAAEDTNVRLIRAHAARQIAAAKPSGQTARGKPPVVTTRLVVAMHWVMFAACALRIALGPL